MRGRTFLRIAATVFLFGALINFPWEMAQAVFYASMGSAGVATWRCFVASLGDGVLILLMWSAGAVTFRALDWFTHLNAGRIGFVVAIALVVGILVEWWGLETQRWAYAPDMPRIPVLNLGLLPLLQIPLLAPLTFRLTATFLRHSRRA